MVVIGVIVALFLIGSFVRSGSWDELQATLSGKQVLGDLEIGQCFDGGRPPADGEEFGYASVVTCDTPHESELIETFSWSDAASDYPTVAGLEAFATPRCRDSFRSYVGEEFDFSELEMTFVYPSGDAWRSGDRSFHCVVHGAGGAMLTDSVRDNPSQVGRTRVDTPG